jgi:hypothetical protein
MQAFTVFTAFASRLRKRWLWNLEASSESRRVKFATGSGQRHPSDQTSFCISVLAAAQSDENILGRLVSKSFIACNLQPL